ncbi:hypothetical protein [Streptococcus suis]|uniref:hypothetical protein n=1 Tax=Streptococcus suis TaxID=1307 RepID=UPI0013A56114|nr:hypothetical protein [Streptococcus suis]
MDDNKLDKIRTTGMIFIESSSISSSNGLLIRYFNRDPGCLGVKSGVKRGKIRVILLVCLDEKRRRSICGLLLFGVSKKC